MQNLRVGAGWRSVVPALARASVLAREGATASKARLEQGAAAAAAAFHLCPSLEVLVPALLEEGVDALARRCTLTPGGCAGPTGAPCVHACVSVHVGRISDRCRVVSGVSGITVKRPAGIVAYQARLGAGACAKKAPFAAMLLKLIMLARAWSTWHEKDHIITDHHQ